ncbi:ROK family protein [Enterococcus faecalis]|uniref:ROK family protein n=1 Tax=Enterococcus faecalis TaxID=1351 RepID=UPI0021E0B103|nr:ROK family protein [Enterococcus faecalis]MCU9758212.1 ROK family protein [Enterococcus faecalis]MCU9772521.1 ROK family protein [Enterococcus faecalis]MCU9772810.1 ROK family protein [Enterococcus faecalis]MCU9792154.1 ROK family protein [Enterococcus faecalis]HEC4826989.1 ROK family protein [Enterococcus faecalis]
MKTLSIDVGGTFVKSALVYENQLFDKKSVATPESLTELTRLFHKLIADYQQKATFERVALAVPGSITDSGVVEFGGAVPYLDQVNLVELIRSFFSGEVVVENDAKAATLGELNKGSLQNTKNAAALILGTGVGLGLVIAGKLYKGTHQQAGEISFLIRDRTILGADSFVGKGLSAVALIGQLAKILDLPADGKLVFEQLEQTTNEEAKKLFTTYCHEIAILCFNLQTILDVEKIVIGGGISQQNILIDGIQHSYNQLFKLSPVIEQTLRKIPIKAAKFQADANLIGAAEVTKE